MLLSLEEVFARATVPTTAHVLLVRIMPCMLVWSVLACGSAGSMFIEHANLHQVDTQWASVADEPATSLGARATAANMCYIIFTSGSTGRPKGTVLQHNSTINYLLGMVRCVCPSHRVCSPLPCKQHVRMCQCQPSKLSTAGVCLCARRLGLGPDDVFLQKIPISFDPSVQVQPPSLLLVLHGEVMFEPAAHASKLPAGARRSCSVHWRAAASWCWQPRVARRTRSTWRA